MSRPEDLEVLIAPFAARLRYADPDCQLADMMLLELEQMKREGHFTVLCELDGLLASGWLSGLGSRQYGRYLFPIVERLDLLGS